MCQEQKMNFLFIYDILCIPYGHAPPLRSHVYTCNSHSGNILPPCYRNNTSFLEIQKLIKSSYDKNIQLTISTSMTMAFTVKVTMFTLAVVTLTIGTLHNTGGPDTLAQDRLDTVVHKKIFFSTHHGCCDHDHTHQQRCQGSGVGVGAGAGRRGR